LDSDARSNAAGPDAYRAKMLAKHWHKTVKTLISLLALALAIIVKFSTGTWQISISISKYLPLSVCFQIYYLNGKIAVAANVLIDIAGKLI